uniref:Phospholipase A2 n=1 Tax=Canis lupus dingo TaxID=286419 RepID=A0A8C0K5F1_CANLU
MDPPLNLERLPGGIMNLNKMIKQVTRKTPIFSYWFYGCHCGPGGRGQPKDATDWCCQTHDCCYEHLKLKGQTVSSLLLHPAADKGTWCEQQLCACDKEMVLCLQRNLDSYQRHLRYYWRPHCRGQTPMC